LNRARSGWGIVVGALALIAFPFLPFVSYSVLGTANLAAYYAMAAISLVVLTGWVGQISLGQAGLVGIGAYATGQLVQGLHLTFPVNMIWAGAVGAVVAILLGVVAVRVRGLYLAVATLIFSWMASEYLFRQEWLTKSDALKLRAFGEPGTFPYLDWTSRRTYFFAAWATVAAAVYLVANVRDSKTGRAFFAVRGSEVAAASMGISVVRTKLTAFAISGALAGIAGNLLIIRDQTVTPDAFKVEISLFFLAIAVVGGLSSLGGAVAAAMLFAALNEVFFRVTAFTGWLEVVPPVLLTLALLAYRGGLAAIPGMVQRLVGDRLDPVKRELGRLGQRFRRPRREETSAAAEAVIVAPRPSRMTKALAPWLAKIPGTRRIEPEERLDLSSVLTPAKPATNGTTPTVELPVVTINGNGNANDHGHDSDESGVPTWRRLDLPAPVLPPNRDDRRPMLEAENVTVRFGGLVAVNDVSLSVREHEIVGLIGPNGAGKTTTFNAIAGLNQPANGHIYMYGQDVTNWTVDQRARLGVGRTFQAIQLLPQLTVFDNLLVATHVHNHSGLLSHFFVGGRTLDAEMAARREVRQVGQLLELEEYFDRVVADLPFGVLRMVELARALVTGAKVIMLDEPASGLDNTETDRLGEILRFVRALGVTMLLIEHDVRMVTSISDYMYVLDYGRLLAEGTPDEIQRDERVIGAYLGAEDDAEQEVVLV
jgi:ABC-type branched-subunit amino acid transport system ATPase component/ABC-type branched-subunit amino acid transport system permease subunit